MAKFNVTGDHYFSITGQLLEIQRQIRLRGGSPMNPELVILALQDIIEHKFSHSDGWSLNFEKDFLQTHPESIYFESSSDSFDKRVWEDFFLSEIENCSRKDWDYIVSGCVPSPVCAVTINSLVKNGVYRKFIRDTPSNFFQGIEQVFNLIKDNPILIQQILKEGKRFHVPFVNDSGYCFVAFFVKANNEKDDKKIKVKIFNFFHDYEWSRDLNDHIVLLPKF